MESYTADGGIASTRSDVLKTWEAEFSKLYTLSDTNFDQEFYNECLQHKQYLKDNTALPSYVPNRLLTKIITKEEVAPAILNSKEGKDPGFD